MIGAIWQKKRVYLAKYDYQNPLILECIKEFSMIRNINLCEEEIGTFCKSSDLPIAVVEKAAQSTLSTRSHNFSELIFVRSGKAVLQTPNSITEIKPGLVCSLPPLTEYSIEETEDLSILCLLYKAEELPLIFYDLTDISGYHHLFPSSHSVNSLQNEPGSALLNYETLGALEKKIHNLSRYIEEQTPGWKITALTQFYHILISLCKAVDDSCTEDYFPIKSVNDVLRYMEIHYKNRIQLKDLTRIANMSESSLNRSFKRIFGFSTLQMLNKIRLRQSEKLLQETTLPVSSIAEHCGFYDSSHFCRKFQDSYCVTPDRFRKKQIKNISSTLV